LIASSISTFAPTFLSFSVYFYIQKAICIFFQPEIRKNLNFSKKNGNWYKNVPSGKTHDKINLAVLFLVLLSFFFILEKPMLHFPDSYLESRRILVFSLAYLFGTFFLSPDLDTKSAPYRRWGAIKVIWHPYQRFFRHRGILHHPVFGPFILILTFVALLYPAVMLGFESENIPVWAGTSALSGVVLAMEVHYISDFLWGKIIHLRHS